MMVEGPQVADALANVRRHASRVVPTPGRKKVALIVETSLAPGREILRGIASYLRREGPWSIAHEPRTLEQSVPRWLRRWHGDGIIARVQSQRVAQAIAMVGVPTIDVLGVVDGLSFPIVHVDDEAIGRLAAEHLLDQGYRRFAFLGIRDENWSNRRAVSFARRVGAAGCACVSHVVSRQTARQESWDDSGPELANWLISLSKPTGLMVASDQLGPHTLEACRSNGIIVPDDLGVVGVDNDEPLCEVSDPPCRACGPITGRWGTRRRGSSTRSCGMGPFPEPPPCWRRRVFTPGCRLIHWRWTTATLRSPYVSFASTRVIPLTWMTSYEPCPSAAVFCNASFENCWAEACTTKSFGCASVARASCYKRRSCP